jgi:bifunctional DNase/RNase
VDDDLIQLRVADVKVAVPAGNGVEAGLVVLEEEAHPYRTLRMFIGQPEARAIHVPWSNTIPPRPSTWDLFVSTIAILDGRIERVVITDVEELRHYFAQIAIVQREDEEPVLITARPSDALALALRSYGAKIYAQPHVLDQAGVLADGTRWVPPEPETALDVAPEPDSLPPTAAEDVQWPSGVEEIGPAGPAHIEPAHIEPAHIEPAVVHEAQEPAIPVVDAERDVVEPGPTGAADPEPTADPEPGADPKTGPEPTADPEPGVKTEPPGKKAKSDADRKKAKKKKKLTKKKKAAD